MIDIKNMPLKAILGWLDAPKDQDHEDLLRLILSEFRENLKESEEKV